MSGHSAEKGRALPVFMLRRRASEPVARLNRATDVQAQALRDRCALACLTRIGEIVEASDLATAAMERAGVDDRAVDLWAPLVAIAFVADHEDDQGRSGQILDVARVLGATRDADAEGGTTARLLQALGAIRAEIGETPAPAELLAALRARAGWEWVTGTRRCSAVGASNASPGPLKPVVGRSGSTVQYVHEIHRRSFCCTG